jgi:DNA-binding NarL/FixJ family response regulator
MLSYNSAQKENPEKKIIVIDEQPITRKGLIDLVNAETDLSVCGSSDNVHDAISIIYDRQPDLVILDLTLKSGSGIDLLKRLKEMNFRGSSLVMSIHDEKIFADPALRSGALGYIMKQAALEEILIAIRRVLEGEVYVSKQMLTHLMQIRVHGHKGAGDTPLANLSDRELEVFRLISQGQSRRHIAEALHLSVKTIETHRAHIMRKLNLGNTMELNRFALNWASGIN